MYEHNYIYICRPENEGPTTAHLIFEERDSIRGAHECNVAGVSVHVWVIRDLALEAARSRHMTLIIPRGDIIRVQEGDQVGSQEQRPDERCDWKMVYDLDRPGLARFGVGDVPWVVADGALGPMGVSH